MRKINKFKWKILLLFLIYTVGSKAQTSININIIGQPIVGETITVEVIANHPSGINKIWLIKDKDYGNKTEIFCNGTTSCSLQIETTLDYIGSIVFDAVLWGLPNNYVTETSILVNFICQSEYCSPDPEINQFFNWMRNVGYDECVIERYYSYVSVPELKTRMKEISRKKPIGYNQTDTIIFYDIIPTDIEATFTGMNIGEAPNCVYSPTSPEFCPNPVSADYSFVENHWRTVFGIDFTFQYQRIEISYVDEFGPPVWNSTLGKWQFIIPNTFYINNLEPHNIAHFAVESWNGQQIRDIDGGSFSAQLFSEPTTLFKFGIYTHEWGHAQGLPHTFVDINGVRKFLTPDGIMSNTYLANTNIFDPLDPLERYVFEPTDGYVDQNTFANSYSQAIVATNQFNGVCENIDPAVTTFTLDSSTDSHYTFKATLDNLGTIDASFIDVFFYDGNLTNAPLIERTYEVIEQNNPFDIFITIEKNLITNDDVFIKVDPLELINDETESNNTLNISNILSVNEDDFSNFQFNVYPNPVSNLLYIKTNTQIEYQADIYSVDGKLISTTYNNSFIDVSEMSNGVYFLQITNLNLGYKFYKRIIVEN